MIKLALWILQYKMRNDPGYAWGWHYNLAMMAHDAGASYEEANKSAANFMNRVFRVNTLNMLN